MGSNSVAVIKQSIINSIVHSHFRLTSAFPHFLMHVWLLLHIYFRRLLSLFPSLFLGRFLKYRKKDVLVRSSAILKSFVNGRFTFLIYLQILHEFQICYFFLSHTQTQIFHFQLMDTFFHCLSHFSGFSFQSDPHSENPPLIFGNTRFHNQFYIWIIISLKTTTR